MSEVFVGVSSPLRLRGVYVEDGIERASEFANVVIW